MTAVNVMKLIMFGCHAKGLQTASARTGGDREAVVVIAQRNNLPPAHPDLPGPLSNTSNITKSQQ